MIHIWMKIVTDDEWFTYFRKSIYHFVERFKGAQIPYVKGSKYYEEYLVVR